MVQSRLCWDSDLILLMLTKVWENYSPKTFPSPTQTFSYILNHFLCIFHCTSIMSKTNWSSSYLYLKELKILALAGREWGNCAGAKKMSLDNILAMADCHFGLPWAISSMNRQYGKTEKLLSWHIPRRAMIVNVLSLTLLPELVYFQRSLNPWYANCCLGRGKVLWKASFTAMTKEQYLL